MQLDVAGRNIELLGETIRLLTPGSQPGGVAPKALHNKGYSGFLPSCCAPRIQGYRRARVLPVISRITVLSLPRGCLVA